jgi:MFS family permease
MSFTSTSNLPRPVYAIAGGRAVSFLGDEIALLAIAFRASSQLGHIGFAAVLIAGSLPLVALAGPSGLLVDRVRTKPLLVTVSLIQAAICVGLAFAPGAALIALVALLACGTSVISPAWQALIPTIVAKEKLPAAFGLLQSSSAIGSLAGPAVGGLLVASFGFSTPLVIDAVSFVVLAVVAASLSVDRIPAGASKAVSWAAVTAGFRIMAKNPMLRALTTSVLAFILTLGVVNVCEIFFVRTVLHAGPAAYGLLGLFMGAGAIITSALSEKIARKFLHPERVFVTGCALLCVTIFSFALSRSLYMAAPLSFVIGVGSALLNVNAVLLLSTHSNAVTRGRVFAAAQGMISAGTIVAVGVGGLLLTVFAPATVIIGGAIASLFALALTAGALLRAPSELEESSEQVAA